MQLYYLLLCAAESCELVLMGLIHCALSQHGCVTLRTAVNISAFRNPTEPLQPGPGPWLYCAVSNEPRVRMGACSKLKYLQRYITTSLFMQPPPIWLIRPFLVQICLTLDKEG